MALFSTDGTVGRLVRKMSASRGFRKVGPKVIPPVDRALHRLTGGRVIVSRLLVTSLVITTTGRKSGLPRESPLACVPDPDTGGWWVVGSNFGQEKHPAWTGNLLAQPEASVSYDNVDTPVTAVLLDDDQKAAIWPTLVETWPAYDDYAAASSRNIRVFHLVPRS